MTVFLVGTQGMEQREQGATAPWSVLAKVPAFILLQQLLPALNKYRVGVGGSLLLTELGLLQQARDLDLVCVADDFDAIVETLSTSVSPVLRPLTLAPHPLYQSGCFARFADTAGTEIDLMANIKVQHAGNVTHWQFDDSQLQWRHSVPWMSAQQWLELYQLFQRPERVALLQQWLK